MKHFLYSALCATTLLASVSACSNNKDSVEQAQQANEAKTDDATATTDMGELKQDKLDFDSDFMTKAASGGMLEVELGNYVVAHATTPEAKQIGQQMVKDHTKANAELKDIATKKNITIPATLGEDQRDVMKDVTDETGVAMDKEYLKEMVKDHQHDVEEFTEASVKASDPDIKAFAAKNVPILKEHLDMATKMQATVDQRP